MEPDHEPLEEHEVTPIFNFFDYNLDKKVSLNELVSVSKIKLTHQFGHKQIHLGLTSHEG